MLLLPARVRCRHVVYMCRHRSGCRAASDSRWNKQVRAGTGSMERGNQIATTSIT